jgi:hypothetical protein
MNFPDFAAIFEVAAPYVPPPTSSSSSDSSSLSSTDIAVIVVVVLVVVGVGIFLFIYCTRTQQSPPAQAYAIDLPAARGTPVTVVNPQVHNPVHTTYSPPSSST